MTRREIFLRAVAEAGGDADAADQFFRMNPHVFSAEILDEELTEEEARKVAASLDPEIVRIWILRGLVMHAREKSSAQ